MNLPYFDQVIELERGEAAELSQVVGDVVLQLFQQLLAQEPVPQPASLLLALPALTRLTNRLSKQATAEMRHVGLPRRKPHRFRLTYLEMAALMLHVLPTATMGIVPLGKVQQKSLNLEAFINFT